MLIAFVAVGAGIAFLPIGLAAGLGVAAAASFAIGLLVANVPEGLLPTITLALAVGVREMARRGALVKRLSARWRPSGPPRLSAPTRPAPSPRTGCASPPYGPRTARPACPPPYLAHRRLTAGTEQPGLLAQGVAACNNADLRGPGGKPAGDPTELALLELAVGCGVDVSLPGRQTRRRQLFRFDPRLKLMTTVDEQDGSLVVNTKGAPEEVLARVTQVHRGRGDSGDHQRRARRGHTRHDRLRAPRPAGAGRRPPGAARRVRRPRPPPGRRTGSVPDRAGGHARPAALAGPRGDRPGAPGRHPRSRRHRRQRAHRRRDRPQRRHRHRPRRDDGGHGHRARRDDRTPARRPARLRPGGGLRAKLPRSQAAHRRRPALGRPGRRHDRRRGQRRPRAAPRGHRRGHGAFGDRRRPRGRHDDPHRRQLRHHRRGGRIRPADLRQRPQVHLLHLHPRRPRGGAIPGLRPGRRGHPAAADRHADSSPSTWAPTPSPRWRSAANPPSRG